ncbi:MAG TPA: BamA/TamA family outer membrane protein, partial [Pirellulaceae bacterium]|nr:BamA/TamA family outer membrane protein [Pirellulaceae bacterium]
MTRLTWIWIIGWAALLATGCSALAPRDNQEFLSRSQAAWEHYLAEGIAYTPETQGLEIDHGQARVTSVVAENDDQRPFAKETSQIVRGQTPQDGPVQPAAYQYPETYQSPPPGSLFGGPTAAPVQLPSIRTGAPNELYPLLQGVPPSGVGTYPLNYTNQADLDIYLSETQTGRINLGGAYNSDNGLVGQFVIDERNFDILRFPRSFRDIRDGTAWRGAGQGFRLELVPGNRVQRYLVSFTEPYLFDTQVSMSVSGYLFDRNYFDWNEQRLGGRIALGYRLTPDLSLSVAVRAENVEISDPRVNTSAQLNNVVGDTDLYLGQVSLINDTRDHPFLPTEGHYLSLTYTQGFGEFDFPRGDLEYRRYRLIYQRPDLSGRHTLSYGTRLGFSGGDTPMFENYFAGGFSTLRGFNFRGAGPVEGDVRVGGTFQFLNTIEYMFPLTPDDMIKAVAFVDFGTIEPSVKINWEDFRVAPGFGFRVHMPAAGFGA